ncbi:hypothetical protein D9M70_434820 [compost metagenome]
MHRQQLRALGAATAVEFDRVQAEHVHAEADAALGEAGACVEDETLRPLPGLVLVAGVDVVAVEVEVAQVQSGLGVFDEAAVGEGGQGAGGDRQGQAGGYDATGERR